MNTLIRHKYINKIIVGNIVCVAGFLSVHEVSVSNVNIDATPYKFSMCVPVVVM